MNTDHCLIFPPGWTPFSPYLALPMLKGYLEKKNVTVDTFDFNVDFFDNILTVTSLKEAENTCTNYLNTYNSLHELTNQEYEHYREVTRALLFEGTINNIEHSKRLFKSEAFFDGKLYKKAKQEIFKALKIYSAAYPGCDIKFHNIDLKFKTDSQTEVIESLNDNKHNPFIKFFEETCIPKLKNKDYGILGISITSPSQLIPALTLVNLIKKHSLNIKHITLGGNYITRLAKTWTVSNKITDLVDSIILFEGEEALYKLHLAIKGEINLTDVNNLIFQKNGVLISNSSLTVPIEELQTPNFDGLEMWKYLMPKIVLPIFSSRSCFGKCTFCTIPDSSHGEYRTLKAERIFMMMGELSKKYQTNLFDFVDETFAPPIMKKLANLIFENKKNYLWYGETRFAQSFTESFCKMLFEGGCRKIQFGLESYNQRVLNLMKKEVKIEWIEPNLINCMKAGLAVHLFFYDWFSIRNL